MLLRFIEYTLFEENGEPQVLEKEPKYLKVSDLLVFGHQMELSRSQILDIWIQLLPCSNLELCCNKLTSIGALDYIFDVIQYSIDRKELKQASGSCSQLIIEGFKEAIESS